MTDSVTIRLPWPDVRLAPHAKGHWRPKAEATKAARGLAFWCAKEAKVPHWPNARLVFTAHPPSLRGDCQNFPAMVKAHIDGIAQAMGCDDKHFRCAFPEKWSEPIKGGAVIVEVTK